MAVNNHGVTTGPNFGYWQNLLRDYCQVNRIQPPTWTIMSDRRGGRTAWSSTVTVEGQQMPARFWYDGQNVNNAREDAAEVAYKLLMGIPLPHIPGHPPYVGVVS